jgi:hypothetical protein
VEFLSWWGYYSQAQEVGASATAAVAAEVGAVAVAAATTVAANPVAVAAGMVAVVGLYPIPV